MPDITPSIASVSQASESTPANSTVVATDTKVQLAGAESTSTLRGDTQLGSMDQLKKKSPKLYNMMLQGIAYNICRDMKERSERLKELIRKGSSRG